MSVEKTQGDFIWTAVKREQRRKIAEADAAIYGAMDAEDVDFAWLAGYAVGVPLDEID
jgi:hypothetical protein